VIGDWGIRESGLATREKRGNVMNKAKVELGKSGVMVAPLGTGTWSWGDRLYWGFGKEYGEAEIHAAFEASLRAGIDFFDTAEVYGFGKSEKFIAKFSRRHADSQIQIATKFFPLPWRLTPGQIVRALRGSLARLEMTRVDLYQIHWSTPLFSVERMMDGLAAAVEKGMTRAVGVSNFNAEQTRRAHARLAKYNIPLASNQIQFNLLERSPDFDGLVETCRELGVTIIAYSPLKYGMLTGKYTPDNPPRGARARRFSAAYLAQIQPLIVTLRQIGENYGGKSPAQVALNWLMRRGAIPIPGAKNTRQLEENAGALGWALSADDVAQLSEVSERVLTRR
jgi:aryl-alcohol dehydrogenase-like predicted oxidoreductase